MDFVYGCRCDRASFDPYVANAVAAELAGRGALSGTGDRQLAVTLKQEAEQAAIPAIGPEANQDGARSPWREHPGVFVDFVAVGAGSEGGFDAY